nr:integrase, catalytic region, zinc finger, CCHC-type, peptidase aspartic, catalytic [Tanacetum cinerariifolium]
MTRNLKLHINFVWKFMGTVCFGNDHVAAILGFGDLQWGNILITRVYFVKGLGHNLFSIGQFCDSDLEVAFQRNACFANVSKNETQKEYRPKVSKSKNVGTHESLATPKPRKLRFLLRWSPTGKMFDSACKIFAPSGYSKHMTGNLKLLINFIWKFLGTVRFGNDYVVAYNTELTRYGFAEIDRLIHEFRSVDRQGCARSV